MLQAWVCRLGKRLERILGLGLGIGNFGDFWVTVAQEKAFSTLQGDSGDKIMVSVSEETLPAPGLQTWPGLATPVDLWRKHLPDEYLDLEPDQQACRRSATQGPLRAPAGFFIGWRVEVEPRSLGWRALCVVQAEAVCKVVLPGHRVVVSLTDVKDGGGLPAHHVDEAELEVVMELADRGSHEFRSSAAQCTLNPKP